jgi:O-antigen/teichoic acid export membrane protein
LKKLIDNKINGLGERSKNIIRHIGWSILFKLGSIVANFIMVPLAIVYLGIEDYGIWLTLSSALTWFMLFDIGLGNGLRNKFAKAKTLGNHDEAQAFVSTAYYTISAIGVALVLSFWSLNHLVNWGVVFNATPVKAAQLSTLLPIIFGFFGMQLVAKLIVSIYQADQHHSIQNKVQFYGQALSLVGIWLLLKLGENSLLSFGVFYSALPLLVLVALNIIAFNGRYTRYRPKLKLCQKKHLREIAGLGLKFFIVQFAAVVLFSTDNFIITHLFGPEEVVPYNLAFKYFSIVIMAYSILVAPYWSSFTEAYAKNDIDWIRGSVSRIQRIWLIVPLSLFVMVLMANQFYALWVGNEVKVPQLMNLSMAIYVLIITFGTIYVQFINGVGKIGLQFIVSIVVMLLNIPLSIILADHMRLGTPGVIMATSLCLSVPMVLWLIQFNKLIDGTAKGIWNK